MIAVPWFKFPWTTKTADLAHDLATRAAAGDAAARGQLDEVKAQADAGDKLARLAWRHLAAVAQLVAAGQPPPSVILQMRGAQVGVAIGMNGGFPNATPFLPWAYQSVWNYGADPFIFEGWGGDADVGQNPAGFRMMFNYPPAWPAAVGEPLPGEIEYEYEVGQLPGLNFGMGPLPGGVPLLPFGMGPFSFANVDGGDYMRGGPGMSEDIELEDRYIG